MPWPTRIRLVSDLSCIPPFCRAVGFILLTGSQCLHGEYRKESPVALIVGTEGGTYLLLRDGTPLRAKPGVFLFSGDKLSGKRGSVTILWCPQGASKKTEYKVQGDFTMTPDSPPTGAGRELDICLLPDLERAPETTTLPSLPELLPEPLAESKVDEHLAQIPPATAAGLQAIRKRDLSDPRLRLAYAVMLSKAGLIDEAIDQYGMLARLWPDESRIVRLILDLRHSGSTREIVHPPNPAESRSWADPRAPGKTSGKVYALVIGIKEYQHSRISDLLFSDVDALEFAKFLSSERGGRAEVTPLINKDARLPMIRHHATRLLAKLGKDDIFVFYAAAHGDMRDGVPIIVTHQADQQDTNLNGLPLREVQKFRYGEKSPFREARVFLDLCHAGRIALLDGPPPKRRPGSPAPVPSNFLFLTATHQGPDAYAYEDLLFGHGVFTYFLLRGLNTSEARDRPDGQYITAQSLSTFVENWVQKATTSTRDGQARQKPTSLLGGKLAEQIADLKLPGLAFSDTRPLTELVIPHERLGRLRRTSVKKRREAPSLTANVPLIDPDLARRIALEDEGETILLRYLQGDEVPQERSDFARGAEVYSEALNLQPGSLFLESRRQFCQGRVLVFDGRYDQAIEHLERSIRIDPTVAFSYNALGIAYLEQGDFPMAALAFNDAIRRAPEWAYPRHNLALTYMQTGDYENAIAAYRDAMARAPDYFYLPYNLGLLFQRINRPADAEVAYLQAASIAESEPPARSEPYIALGLLKASQTDWGDAERYYKQALTIPSTELSGRTARHNLALLYARKRSRWDEAVNLWRANGDYLPSRLALAQGFAARRQPADAIREYREILRTTPDHVAARLQLAVELENSGDRKGATSELRQVVTAQPDNPLLLERLAGNLASLNMRAEAIETYRSALSFAPDPSTRKRILRAVERLEQKR